MMNWGGGYGGGVSPYPSSAFGQISDVLSGIGQQASTWLPAILQMQQQKSQQALAWLQMMRQMYPNMNADQQRAVMQQAESTFAKDPMMKNFRFPRQTVETQPNNMVIQQPPSPGGPFTQAPTPQGAVPYQPPQKSEQIAIPQTPIDQQSFSDLYKNRPDVLAALQNAGYPVDQPIGQITSTLGPGWRYIVAGVTQFGGGGGATMPGSGTGQAPGSSTLGTGTPAVAGGPGTTEQPAYWVPTSPGTSAATGAPSAAGTQAGGGLGMSTADYLSRYGIQLSPDEQRILSTIPVVSFYDQGQGMLDSAKMIQFVQTMRTSGVELALKQAQIGEATARTGEATAQTAHLTSETQAAQTKARTDFYVQKAAGIIGLGGPDTSTRLQRLFQQAQIDGLSPETVRAQAITMVNERKAKELVPVQDPSGNVAWMTSREAADYRQRVHHETVLEQQGAARVKAAWERARRTGGAGAKFSVQIAGRTYTSPEQVVAAKKGGLITDGDIKQVFPHYQPPADAGVANPAGEGSAKAPTQKAADVYTTAKAHKGTVPKDVWAGLSDVERAWLRNHAIYGEP